MGVCLRIDINKERNKVEEARSTIELKKSELNYSVRSKPQPSQQATNSFEGRP